MHGRRIADSPGGVKPRASSRLDRDRVRVVWSAPFSASGGQGAMTRVLAPAKINLFLEILRKRPDGYHDLRSLLVEQ